MKNKLLTKLTDFMNLKVVPPDKVVTVLNNNEKLYIKGKLLIKVLCGKLEILGSTLNPSNEYVEVFSPRGYSLLYFQGFKDELNTDISKLIEEGLNDSNFIGDCLSLQRSMKLGGTDICQKTSTMENQK